MASRAFTLKDEERRRQITIVVLAAGLVISTLPVRNERALFSPFADAPLLGQFSPVAYAMFVGYGPGGGAGPGGPGGRGGPGPGGPGGGRPAPPPTAFAARVPPAVPAGAVPPAPPIAAFVRPVGDPFPPASPLGPNGFGPGDPLGVPGGPGPISVVPGPPLDTTTPPPPVPTTPVPEPATWAMLMLGFATIGGLLRHVRRVRTGRVSAG